MLHDQPLAEAPSSAKTPDGAQSGTTAATDHRVSAQAIAIVAHDLRGPLANIAALIELIEASDRAGTHGKISSLTQRATRTIDRMEGLIAGVLDRVRGMGDPFGFDPEFVDLADVARDVTELNRHAAAKRSVTLDYHCTQRLVVRGCEQLLRQAVDNLVNNAARHAPSGTRAQIDVQALGPSAVVTVTNDCDGAALDADERQLGSFVRPRSSSTNTRTVLGHWITRQIAERHGGQLTCYKAGSGITFALIMPRAERTYDRNP